MPTSINYHMKMKENHNVKEKVIDKNNGVLFNECWNLVVRKNKTERYGQGNQYVEGIFRKVNNRIELARQGLK